MYYRVSYHLIKLSDPIEVQKCSKMIINASLKLKLRHKPQACSSYFYIHTKKNTLMTQVVYP